MGSLDNSRWIGKELDNTLKRDSGLPGGDISSDKNWSAKIKMSTGRHQNGPVLSERPPTHTSTIIMSTVKARELENTRRITKELAIDTVYYVSNCKKLSASSKHAKTMRRTVDELLDRHSILFKGMVNKLDITSQNGKRTFTNVIDEMFADKKINWGRVVSVYAFGGRLAKHCAEKNQYDIIDKITEFLGDYVSEKMALWINNQGGWDKFDEYFEQQPTTESRLWQGLLMTAVGLGALATMVAVK